MNIMVPVSPGELLDKITILRVKAERITDPSKLKNVERELALLDEVARTGVADAPELQALVEELTEVNRLLWDIEDGKRDCERRQDFGAPFVQLARSVYIENDRRARIKRDINRLTSSDIIEEKSYEPYLNVAGAQT